MNEPLGHVARTASLNRLGYSPRQLARLVKQGKLDRVRHGAYADPLGDAARHSVVHRRLVLATVPELAHDACISHTSAAVMHDLPVPPNLGRVHATRSRQSGQGRRNENVHIHGAPLSDADIARVDGILVTSIARTVVDSARILNLGRGVAMADAALSAKLIRPDEIDQVINVLGRRVGVARARTVSALGDGRSESPGESLSRVKFIEHALPLPDLQRELFTDEDVFVARVDFIWDEYELAGEFDGKIKYGRALRPGVPVEQIVYEEKLREDAIRELGMGVVRWTWADIFSGRMLTKVQRAIDRAGS